jgi:hypothetical protein
MIRIVIDSVAVLCAFLMVARMKPSPAVTTFAMRIGLIGAGLHTAGQLAIYFSPVRLPDEMPPPTWHCLPSCLASQHSPLDVGSGS